MANGQEFKKLISDLENKPDYNMCSRKMAQTIVLK